MASLTLAMMPGSLAYGRVRRHLSPMAIFALGFGMMGLGMAVISASGSLLGAWLGVMVGGLGMGPMMPNFVTYFMGFVPRAAQGRASGLLTTAFFAGQFAAPLLAAPLVLAFGLDGTFLALAAILAVVSLALAARAAMLRRVVVEQGAPRGV
jgi:MFS family permease